MLDTIEFYANPETYAAILVIPDRPSGAFADDFDDPKHGLLPGPRPGKLARRTIKAMQKAGAEKRIRDVPRPK